MLKNIVVFGGSFDPIHFGHINIIRKMFLQLDNIEKFYIIPTGNHPESKEFLFSSDERLLMIKSCLGILSEEEKNEEFSYPVKIDFFDSSISVLDIEIESDKKSYTYDTLQYIYEKHPNSTLNLLMGGDQSNKFSTWYKSEEISNISKLWVYPRGIFEVDPNFEWNILDIQKNNISSSYIKSMIHNKDVLLDENIPETVKYIITKKYFK